MTSNPPMIIDADSHLHEPPDMWRTYADRRHRDAALAIEDDDHGDAWLTWRGQRLYPAEIQVPGRPGEIGDDRHRRAGGRAPAARYEETLPPAYTDPRARVAKLDEWGLDAQVLFPNFGLLWESMLADDLDATCANMGAWNRWSADVAAEGDGRLHPVAHLTLRDAEWVRRQLAELAEAGIRAAMVAPAPVDGMALADRSLDPVWAAFCDTGVAPVFHVGGFRRPLEPAWYHDDLEPVDTLMGSIFLWLPPAVALADLAVHGTLARFPDLRIGVVELSAHWVPSFLLMLDGAWEFYNVRHGGPVAPLAERPSEYVRRQVRVAALPYEDPARLVGKVGADTYMVGSDWPHAEGIADPVSAATGAAARLDKPARDKLLAGNVSWLLGLT